MAHGRHEFNRRMRRGGFSARGAFLNERDFAAIRERDCMECDRDETDADEDEIRAANESRFLCRRRMPGGACSPAKFDCLCHRNGMCVEAKA